MRETITISLPASLRRSLDRAVKEDQLNRSDVIREALRRFFAIREFRRLRGVMVSLAEKRGLYKDEDVFRRLP
jgi:metal-responsive CopG/Arc/MetJ family transcriptional regulator